MGKKKIALVDLSQSDSPQLKATGVRSQKLTLKKPPKVVDVPIQPLTAAPQPPLKPETKPELTQTKTKTKVKLGHKRSKKYLEAKKLINQNKTYPVKQAIKLLRQISKLKFDPSVELHLNLNVEKLSGELLLPHGTGKTLKVEIASENTLAKLNDGVIDFDVLIAEPKMMPKLAKFAKLLGPRGLMPNPKTGTITDDPEAMKKKLAGGMTRYKSEPKAPLLHLVVGKLSFQDRQLQENIETALKTIQLKNIASAYLCSSMSPSIKLDLKA